MNKYLLAVLFLLTCVLSVNAFEAKWQNALKPKGKSVTVSVTDKGKSLYKIVIPNNPKENENKAGETLKKYFRQIFDTDFEIIRENELNENDRFISLGETQLLADSGEKGSFDFNQDGYAIKEKNKNIYIFGGVWSGPLNGVYALLEEDLGCRFWTKLKDDTIPVIKNGKLSFVPRAFNPAFITRGPENCEMLDAEYIEKNRLRSYDAYGFCHTSFNYVSVNDFEAHPERFGTENGERTVHQLCWSDPSVIDIITLCVKQAAAQGNKRINVSPMDGWPLCDCPKCNALDKPEGTKAASYINALNTVCERMEEEYPDVRIIALAYLDYVTPPKTIKPHKNLTIMCCSDSSDWSWPFCNYEETGKFKKDLCSWIETGADTLTWNYVTDFDHYLLPNPNTQVVIDNIRLIKNYGAGGVFLQGNCYPNAVCASGYMKTWVWGKLLINPNFSEKELIKDFIYGYYGECGDEIYKYEMSLIDLQKKAHKIPHNPNTQKENEIAGGLATVQYDDYKGQGVDVGGIRWTPDAPIYTDRFVSESMKLMDKALAKAQTEEMKEKIKYMRLGPIYLYLGRNIGYFQGSGNYIRKDFDRSKTDYYMSLVNELDETLTDLGVITVSETAPWDRTKEIFMNKWKEVLQADPSDTKIVNIENTGWLFRISDTDTKAENFIEENYDTEGWKEIETGKTWDEQGFPKHIGNAWYKKDIDITGEMLNGENLFFATAAADEELTLYVNGKLVKEHTLLTENCTAPEIYTKPVVCDIKPYLKEGKNHIAVMIGNTMGAGGLYKPIKLVITHKPNTPESIIAKIY